MSPGRWWGSTIVFRWFRVPLLCTIPTVGSTRLDYPDDGELPRAADNTEAARRNELAATRGYLLEYRRKDIIKFGVKNNR
jgi:hypothetical protein